MSWHPNPGRPPIFETDDPAEACPADRIPADQAASARVYVRLKNGRAPAESWPLLGRPATRWSRTGFGFDIAEWRRA